MKQVFVWEDLRSLIFSEALSSSVHPCLDFICVILPHVSSVHPCLHVSCVLTLHVPHITCVLTLTVPHITCVLNSPVSSFHMWPHFTCPHYTGVLTSLVSSLQLCPHFTCVLTFLISLIVFGSTLYVISAHTVSWFNLYPEFTCEIILPVSSINTSRLHLTHNLTLCRHSTRILTLSGYLLHMSPHFSSALTLCVPPSSISSLYPSLHFRFGLTLHVSSPDVCPHFTYGFCYRYQSPVCLPGFHFLKLSC